jgi:hypothetical protein
MFTNSDKLFSIIGSHWRSCCGSPVWNKNIVAGISCGNRLSYSNEEEAGCPYRICPTRDLKPFAFHRCSKKVEMLPLLVYAGVHATDSTLRHRLPATASTIDMIRISGSDHLHVENPGPQFMICNKTSQIAKLSNTIEIPPPRQANDSARILAGPLIRS